MKNLTIIRAVIIIVALVSIAYLILMNEADTKSLSGKIRHYENVSDSLRRAVNLIDANVHHKDSILLLYLASLDKTLEELNKESAKNRLAIASNFALQDSIRAAFCRDMERLDQKPSECH
jgi:hypothetical protein